MAAMWVKIKQIAKPTILNTLHVKKQKREQMPPSMYL
jgi:hypothetical protein